MPTPLPRPVPPVPPVPLPPVPPPDRPRPPLDLPRQVMRRTSLVAAGVLLLALLLGLARMADDMDGEVDAAMTLATLMARLGDLAERDDPQAVQALRTLQLDSPLRHLVLHLHDAQGRLLLGPLAEPPVSPPMRWLLAAHRKAWSGGAARQVVWTVARPGGGRWTVSLSASHESERREAMQNLIGILLLLLLCIAGLMLVMHWNLRRAFAPLGRLLDAIAGIELHNAQAVQALPTMPIRELEAVAAALRHLGRALEGAEDQRRLLSHQVLSLQEDERARLARELHDEFGQRLTALRVDAAWLARRVAEQPALKQVVDGMSLQCERVQQDIRALLTRLQPFGPLGEAQAGGESLARLVALLRSLVASWAQPGREASTSYRLNLAWQDAAGQPLPWPEGPAAERLLLPRPLVLTLYRISQEALTNVARHADATRATLSLGCRGPALPGQVLRIAWSLSDDGRGMPGDGQVQPRGNGIAGIQERVWAQGGDLRLGPVQPGGAMPGLRLEAEFTAQLLSLQQAAAGTAA